MGSAGDGLSWGAWCRVVGRRGGVGRGCVGRGGVRFLSCVMHVRWVIGLAIFALIPLVFWFLWTETPLGLGGAILVTTMPIATWIVYWVGVVEGGPTTRCAQPRGW